MYIQDINKSANKCLVVNNGPEVSVYHALGACQKKKLILSGEDMKTLDHVTFELGMGGW